MSLMDRARKASKLEHTSTLDTSVLFNNRRMVPTGVPMINVALSADLDGGLQAGHTMLAGPSKHFKTGFALLLASAYLREHPNSILIFYMNEFGSPLSYFDMFGIPHDRVLVKPFTDIEKLKFDLIPLLDETLTIEDKAVIVIDSIGNASSKKELEDAKTENSATDMSRAKALKGLFRMVTPFLTLKDVPLITINHTYQELALFPKTIVGGGTGAYYSADNIWIIGRQQDKVGTGAKAKIAGYHFVINIEKSRYVKEKAKIPISVSWEDGVVQFSGLLEIALAGGFVSAVGKGYQRVDQETGELTGPKLSERELGISEEFWQPVLDNAKFKTFIKNTFAVGGVSLVDPEELVEVAGD